MSRFSSHPPLSPLSAPGRATSDCHVARAMIVSASLTLGAFASAQCCPGGHSSMAGCLGHLSAPSQTPVLAPLHRSAEVLRATHLLMAARSVPGPTLPEALTCLPAFPGSAHRCAGGSLDSVCSGLSWGRLAQTCSLVLNAPLGPNLRGCSLLVSSTRVGTWPTLLIALSPFLGLCLVQRRAQ